jgi:hypothetical protein
MHCAATITFQSQRHPPAHLFFSHLPTLSLLHPPHAHLALQKHFDIKLSKFELHLVSVWADGTYEKLGDGEMAE